MMSASSSGMSLKQGQQYYKPNHAQDLQIEQHVPCRFQLIMPEVKLLCLPAVGLAEYVPLAEVQQSKVLQPAPAGLL
jgi:hypothetical protein